MNRPITVYHVSVHNRISRKQTYAIIISLASFYITFEASKCMSTIEEINQLKSSAIIMIKL